MVRAGLWGKEVWLRAYDNVSFETIFLLSEEQTLGGVVLAGLERSDVKPRQELLRQWIGVVQLIEQRNKAMNVFVAKLISQLREANIHTIIVKGQGIAQCYDKPLWRESGDVDLLSCDKNYENVKLFLLKLASSVEEEGVTAKHLGMTIDEWVVELHGTMRSCCLSKMDKVIDNVQNDIFFKGNVRTWINGNTQIFLPSPDNDVVLIFTHIIKHFFHGGIGLRQICDWCRLLWTYRDCIDSNELETNIRTAGLVSEWNVFATLAVKYLGMPVDAIPFYKPSTCYERKADRVLSYILEVGNFGNNRDKSYYIKKSKIAGKFTSFWRHTTDYFHHFFVFPIDTLRVWLRMLVVGTIAVIKKK